MSTYVQDQRIVLIFWIGLYENAIELRRNINCLYNRTRDLTEAESKIVYCVFNHCQCLMRAAEDHRIFISRIGNERPTFDIISEAHDVFMNTISFALEQITKIRSKFMEASGNDCEFTAHQKKIIYIINAQKSILLPRLHLEHAIHSIYNSGRMK